MKRFLYVILLTLFVIFPNNVFAVGDITVSTNSLTVEQGSSKTFIITAYNTVGDVLIESKNSSIASVNTKSWSTGIIEEKQTKTETITVTGKSVGTTKIILNIDAATFDEEDKTSIKEITVNVTPAKSSNANLSGITINSSLIDKFSSSTTTYTINTDKSSIMIDAKTEDSKASVSGTGKKELSYGLNTFEIVVKAENGSKKIYTLKITRKDDRSSNNLLSSLKVSPKNINFDSGKTSYNLEVDYSVKEIKIDAKAKDSKASVSGIGTYKLDVYLNTFNIVVKAENGSKKTYTLNVSRKDENGNALKLSTVNTLESLVVEGYDIKFNKDKDIYYLDVKKNVNKVNIIAKSTDSKALVKVNNLEVLELGDNIITIDVTAEDGTIKTYKIIVNRDNDVPKTTLDKLLEVIDTVDGDTLIVNIKDDNNIITKEMLEKLKASNKKLIVNKYMDERLLYTWEIDGKNINECIDINTLIEFYSSLDKEINELTDYSRYLYINNNLDTSVFNNIKLKIYSNDKYNSQNIYGYVYDNGKLSLKYDELKYHETYIEINKLDKGTYVITQKDLEQDDGCIHKVIAIVECIIIVLLIMFMIFVGIYFKKKKNRI